MANLLNTYLHNFFHFWALRFSFNLCVLSFQCPHATCVLYIHKGAAPLFPPSSALHMPIWILCMFHQEKMLRMWDFLLLLTAPRICTCSNTQMTCMLFACLGMPLLLCRCCCHFSYLWISETKAIAKQCAWLTQVWISHADSMYRHKQLHKPIQNSQPCTLHTHRADTSQIIIANCIILLLLSLFSVFLRWMRCCFSSMPWPGKKCNRRLLFPSFDEISLSQSLTRF